LLAKLLLTLKMTRPEKDTSFVIPGLLSTDETVHDNVDVITYDMTLCLSSTSVAQC